MKIKQKKQDDTLTVSIEGRVDTLTAPKLQESIKLDGIQNLLIDLQKMDYISSAGLRVFVGLLKEVNATHKTMRIFHLRPLVREIFYETGFDKIFEIGR